MMKQFTTEELEKLKEAASLLESYKYNEVFGDISGALQKVLDYIEIHTQRGPGKPFDFISPEKLSGIKGSEYLAPIISAIRDRKVIRLYYQPFYEEKPYFADIHPYLLKEYKSRWYLIGLNDFKEQIRTYALDRIHDLQLADITYRGKDFSATDYFRNSIGVITPSGPPPKIVVAVQKTQAQYLISKPWHVSQNIEEESDEEVFFSFRVHPTYEFTSLLLSLGKDLRIIEPESLKNRIREELVEMLKRMD